jgi:hypothetical protein
MEPWEIVAGVALDQYMLIATWQAESAGVARRALAARVKGHGWSRPLRGVTGLPAPDSSERDLAAAVLAYARPTGAGLRVECDDPSSDERVAAIVKAALHAGHAVTGRSAAWLHGFAAAPEDRALWLPDDSGRVTREGIRLRYGETPAGEILMVKGLPCLDPEGAIIDTARTPVGTFEARVDELVWLMSRADSLRLATVDSVQARALDLGLFWGCHVLQAAVARAKGTLSHSKWEHRGRTMASQALESLGLTVESRPYEVWVDGTRIAEADIAAVSILLDVEIDGPHHRFLAQQLRDQERDRRLRRAGWEVERFPVELVRDSPKVYMARVRAAAEARLTLLDR